MTLAGKIITALILAAIFLMIITHPGGFATDATAGGNVLNGTLQLISGQGTPTATGGRNMGMAA